MAVERSHKRAAVSALLSLLTIYICVAFLKPGFLTELLSMTSLGFITLTALARVNDIERGKVSKRWQLRRLGLTMAGIGAVTTAIAELSNLLPSPDWRMIFFRWGIAITWLTTPHMPPWWRWISYKDPKDIQL